MGNDEIKLLTVKEELKMHENQSWDARKLDDGLRYLSVLSKDPLKSAFGLMNAFQPSPKEFTEAAILDDFTTSWQGDLLSAQRSGNPEVFFRRIIDQIEVREKKLSNLSNTSGNLVMLVKIYLSLSGVALVVKDDTAKKNLQWLKQAIIKMRLSFFSWHGVTGTLLSSESVQFFDKFVKQNSHTSGESKELRSKVISHILSVLENWNNFLMEHTERQLDKSSKQISRIRNYDVSNWNKWADLGAIIVDK